MFPTLCGWPGGADTAAAAHNNYYLPKPCYNPATSRLLLPTVLHPAAKDMMQFGEISNPFGAKRCSAFTPYSKVAKKADFGVAMPIGIKTDYLETLDRVVEVKKEIREPALQQLSSERLDSPNNVVPEDPRVSPKPTDNADYERRKADFLRTWNEVAKQIPSTEEIAKQNPHWSREKVRLYEEYKNPLKLFDLAEDVDAMNRLFALFRDEPMTAIAEEHDEDL